MVDQEPLQVDQEPRIQKITWCWKFKINGAVAQEPLCYLAVVVAVVVAAAVVAAVIVGGGWVLVCDLLHFFYWS